MTVSYRQEGRRSGVSCITFRLRLYRKAAVQGFLYNYSDRIIQEGRRFDLSCITFRLELYRKAAVQCFLYNSSSQKRAAGIVIEKSLPQEHWKTFSPTTLYNESAATALASSCSFRRAIYAAIAHATQLAASGDLFATAFVVHYKQTCMQIEHSAPQTIQEVEP
jgi:hypothetical protein